MRYPSLKVVGIAGSLRQRSLNSALLRAAAELAPTGMQVEHFDLAPIPLFNADLLAAGEPQPVLEFKTAIQQADAVLIATPEYNHSIPGVLKNALDWASRPRRESPLRDKPLAIVGAGGSFGTLQAQNHLREIALALGMQTLTRPQLYVSHAWEKFDPQGNLTDEPTRQRLAEVLTALARWTIRLQADFSTKQQANASGAITAEQTADVFLTV